MREALWRGCLWQVCLAAAARLATLAVAAGEAERQPECEVLDLSKASPGYFLPTNLTVRPWEAGWLLDVTLGHGTRAEVCVRLEDKQARLRLTVLATCDGGVVRDYSFLNVPASLGVWTSLRMDVAANTVIVSAPYGITISVETHGSSLPDSGTQVVVANTRKVEAAIGCRTNCPWYRYSAPGKDKKVTVKEWFGDTGKLYFRPGNAFKKLEYEVRCTTLLGHTIFPHRADIRLDANNPPYIWHLVNLIHHSGLATVSLDHMMLKNLTLPETCTFDQHIIRVMGDGLFSFSCNPSNGYVEGMEDGRSLAYITTAQARMSQIAKGVITAESIVVVLLLITVSWLAYEKYNMKPSPQPQQTVDNPPSHTYEYE